MTETYIQVQTAGLAEEKGLIDTEEEQGQAGGTVLSLGICPCLGSQSAEECHPLSLRVSQRGGRHGQQAPFPLCCWRLGVK